MMPRPALIPAPVAPAAADPAPEVLTLLRQIAADLHTLATRQPATRVVDEEAAAALLQAIAASVGPHSFCTSDLLDRVPAPAHATLRAAMLRACGSVSPRSVGRLLRQYEGETFGGLRVTRDGNCRDGALWLLVSG